MRDNKNICGRQRNSPPLYPKLDAFIKANWGVTPFCREIGISYVTYYCMQNGRTMPTLDTVYKILNKTGLSFEEAFSKEG